MGMVSIGGQGLGKVLGLDLVCVLQFRFGFELGLGFNLYLCLGLEEKEALSDCYR